MTTAQSLIAARRSQTASHNAAVRRYYRIDAEGADPIVEVWVCEHPADAQWTEWDAPLAGEYRRRGYGDDEPWNPVFAGDTSPLFTDERGVVACNEDGAWS